ncbi:MAG: GPW/gp25 family protein [Bacteroidaceae bacterium]|nr:GPW/gp25 family protein [Bacteroidaceae bacterium]
MEDHIGKGWSFPPHFNKSAGSVEMVTDETEIEQSLTILFSTQLNERLFRPNYGCNLDRYMFKGFDGVMALHIEETIKEAITEYEPRITLDKVEVDVNDHLEGKMNISLFYTIDATGKKYNMVYPYYFENI